jgi:hypothetical protein
MLVAQKAFFKVAFGQIRRAKRHTPKAAQKYRGIQDCLFLSIIFSKNMDFRTF